MNDQLALLLCLPALISSCASPFRPSRDEQLAEQAAMVNADSTARVTMDAQKAIMVSLVSMFESGNADGFDTLVANDVVEHASFPGITSTGANAWKDMIVLRHQAFPDLRTSILSIVGEGDMVMAHLNVMGTSTGPIAPGTPAAQRKIDLNGADIMRFKNGKVVEHWSYWDGPGMLSTSSGPMVGAAEK